MLDIEIAGGCFDLVDRRGRDDGNRMALGAMGFNQRPRFRIDFPRDIFCVKLFAKFEIAFFGDALHEFRSAGHQPRKAHISGSILCHHVDRFDDFFGGHFPPFDFLPQHRGGRITSDDRAIKIEQGGDMRAFRSVQNVLQMGLIVGDILLGHSDVLCPKSIVAKNGSFSQRILEKTSFHDAIANKEMATRWCWHGAKKRAGQISGTLPARNG